MKNHFYHIYYHEYSTLSEIMQILLPLINVEETEPPLAAKVIHSRNRAQTWFFELQRKCSFPFPNCFLFNKS